MAQGSVHILFVHGVGHHSRLSSLLSAYQALRTDVRSTEVPHVLDDLLGNWSLAEFNQFGPPPYLRLRTKLPDDPGPLDAYVYEANYADLAEVVRKNQPLDITYLFIGLDLAVNVARERLRKQVVPGDPGLARQLEIASNVQRLAEVLVAATVPILGLPSLLVRNYTRTWVAAFVRFFEDVATFSMDGQGQQMIARHFSKTIDDIVDSPRFRGTGGRPEGELIIAAHSLGTIVSHNFLLTEWKNAGTRLPARLLTFGSPIGLVCWLWLFLDFPSLRFEPARRPTGNEYFVWTPMPAPAEAVGSLHWVNVVNHLDPIATAFPAQYVHLGMGKREIEGVLAGGDVQHHYIKTGGVLSAGKAHSDYLADRERFSEIIARFLRLVPDNPPTLDQLKSLRTSATHWKEAVRDLWMLQVGATLLGVGAIALYFIALGWAFGLGVPSWMAILYVVPPLTVRYLAFFQKLFFGRLTKRTTEESLATLSFLRLSALPYRIRALLQPLVSFVLGWVSTLLRPLRFLTRSALSFLPTLMAMIFPLWWANSSHAIVGRLYETESLGLKLALLAFLFAVYSILFAISEFARSWRNLVSATSR